MNESENLIFRHKESLNFKLHPVLKRHVVKVKSGGSAIVSEMSSKTPSKKKKKKNGQSW